MKVWAYSKQTGKTEQIDECSKKDGYYMVREYQAAFGPTFIVWAGLKRDNPWVKYNRGIDETSHYKSER